ncbi:polynucleotide adenylyltransferase PcnB [Spongorhabdus nitratireducens]
MWSNRFFSWITSFFSSSSTENEVPSEEISPHPPENAVCLSGRVKIIPRDQHPVSRKQISHNALKVLYRLSSQGYDSFLVGGCIRDLLVGIQPKDYDVATNATPEEVKALFRNSRIIGRRFKLVHVQFGREIIEVATFRAPHDTGDHGKDRSHHSDNGRILRDNVYGTIEEDAARRDFTINALYYTTDTFSIHDHAGGIRDIQDKVIRLMGDPVRRYHEDPVRMLRAVRFAAKLGFTIEPATSAPIAEYAHLLSDIPAARMFDEVLKLLQTGKGEQTFHMLRQYGLFSYLFPATEHHLAHNEQALDLIIQALRNTDQRVQEDRPVTPAFLYAAMLWHPMMRLTNDIVAQGIPPVPAMQQAASIVLDNQNGHTTIPKRFSIPVREIWEMQRRLEKPHKRRVNSLMEHPRFRAAYDFLLLREHSGEDLGNIGHWWTEIQATDEDSRGGLMKNMNNPGKPRRRRRRNPNYRSRNRHSNNRGERQQGSSQNKSPE